MFVDLKLLALWLCFLAVTRAQTEHPDQTYDDDDEFALAEDLDLDEEVNLIDGLVDGLGQDVDGGEDFEYEVDLNPHPKVCPVMKRDPKRGFPKLFKLIVGPRFSPTSIHSEFNVND